MTSSRPNTPSSQIAAPSTPVVAVRYLLAGVVAFVAIAGGIYVGMTTAVRTATSERAMTSLNRSFLIVGDSLPDYTFWDVESREKVSSIAITGSHYTLFLFVSRSCGACITMSEFWNERVIPTLRRDILLVAVYDDSDWYSDSTRRNTDLSFPTARVVTMDRPAYEDIDGITATPTLVAVGASGRIVLVATGFHPAVGAEFLNGIDESS